MEEDKTDVAPRPFFLQGAEWLAVLPAPPGVFGGATELGLGAAPDPAADARRESPLDLRVLIAALEPKAPAMAAAVRLQAALQPTRRPLVRFTVQFMANVIPVPAFCVFEDGYYGTAQLVVGLVGYLLLVFAGTLGLALFAAYRSSFAVAGGSTQDRQSAAGDVSTHGAAGMARWLQLVSRGGAGANGEEVALLKHDPKDDLCPCPAVSCAGRLPWLAGVARFGEASYKLVIFLLYLVLTIAALAIFPPMSPRIWATPWSAFLIALYMLLALALGVPLAFGRFSTNLPLLQLSRRVTRRAMKLALTPMVQRYREAADAKIAAWPGSARRERAGYMDLHSLLSRTWRNRIRGYSTTSPMIIPVSTAVIFALVSMAVGGCLPALYLGYLGYILVAHLLTDLVHVAASNDLVSDIRALYLDAASELASLRRELTSAPAAEPADPALLAAIEADVDVLAGFTDADRYRARFLGFVVTFGTVRTLLVTAVTLGIGLWSVLRNLGVVLAGDLVCPPRGA